jgi:hypothetical protein
VYPKILSSVKLSIPGPEEVSRRTDITAILVRGDVDDYAAYIGAGRDVEFVRKFGNKMSYAQAASFFPYLDLDEARYRK